MDALASLAFGIIVVQVIRDLGVDDPTAVAGSTVRAGIFSSLLMAFIYIAVTIAGTQSRGVLEASENGGTALAQIAQHYLGSAGLFILAATVTLASYQDRRRSHHELRRDVQRALPDGPKYRIWAIIFSPCRCCLRTSVQRHHQLFAAGADVPLSALHRAHCAGAAR